jgi:hypothetical protein
MGDRECAWLKSSEHDKQIAEAIHLFFQPQPRKATPYDKAWDALRSKALDERYAGHLNFCPRCWVARVRGVTIPRERACMDCIGLTKLDEAEGKKTAKCAKTLEQECAEWKANRLKKAKPGRSCGPIGVNGEEDKTIARLDGKKYSQTQLEGEQAAMRERYQQRKSKRAKLRRKKRHPHQDSC